MYIEYTFKVNSYSLEKGVISVSYIPVDDSRTVSRLRVVPEAV
jgi:hypothetical protein